MKLYKPEVFQGRLNSKKYFEGWYFKTVANGRSLVLIPGISLGEDPHAFIQLIDGAGSPPGHHRFPIEGFGFNTDRFEISIGENYFSDSGCRISIEADSTDIKAELDFSGISRFPRNLFAPGIMGPYSFVPAMECYHGLVSADHSVTGWIRRNGDKEKIESGRGYIEKDWGRSMPSSWIWLQSNIFETPGISIMLSIARIPWLGKSFAGHLGFLLLKEKYYSFATYNGSRYIIDDSREDRLLIRLENRKHSLVIDFENQQSGSSLLAPVNGAMDRTIRESTDTEINVSFYRQSGELLFEGTGRFSGIEVTGDLRELK